MTGYNSGQPFNLFFYSQALPCRERTGYASRQGPCPTKDEAETHRADKIVVEPTKLLVYPTAFYYFVTPSNVKLALKIERGLRKALEDGSFDKLFNEYHERIIAKANLNKRHRYQLNNPLLPITTPIADDALWFKP